MNTVAKTAIGKIVSFLSPNFEYNNVAANESDKAEDSLFKVEIIMMKLKIINFELDCCCKY